MLANLSRRIGCAILEVELKQRVRNQFDNFFDLLPYKGDVATQMQKQCQHLLDVFEPSSHTALAHFQKGSHPFRRLTRFVAENTAPSPEKMQINIPSYPFSQDKTIILPNKPTFWLETSLTSGQYYLKEKLQADFTLAQVSKPMKDSVPDENTNWQQFYDAITSGFVFTIEFGEALAQVNWQEKLLNTVGGPDHQSKVKIVIQILRLALDNKAYPPSLIDAIETLPNDSWEALSKLLIYCLPDDHFDQLGQLISPMVVRRQKKHGDSSVLSNIIYELSESV